MPTQCRICSTRKDCPICEARLRKIEQFVKRGLSLADAERLERAMRDPLWPTSRQFKQEAGMGNTSKGETDAEEEKIA